MQTEAHISACIYIVQLNKSTPCHERNNKESVSLNSVAHHLKANCFTYKSKAARLHVIHMFNTWKHELGGAECDHSSVQQEL